MSAKTGRSVTYDDRKPFMKSHSTMRIWSRDVIRQIKNVISPLLQGKWPPNLAGSWFMGRVTYPWSCMTLGLRVHLRWRDKLKTKYLLFGKSYGHQTYQSGNFCQKKPTQEVTWHSDHVVTWGQKTNVLFHNTYNYQTTQLFTWSFNLAVTWQNKDIIFPLPHS